ncbi:hypothetical protein K437DRAFT_257960 [Tilletiaria anomala UBC 951]|uniref:Uncharacterized protein n=1 Tax=Tilletiaria anomala (strain ATCC 24038 / CBS 436.72 / UBC 951) TaxID=1037660 RepID=A0A066VL15_TILAU|nr:uncharacterized protein K437DRAFT_257960 [Tilletiaria anomala UBC 951]KDN42181.1 hypothetical protein K437DRAFT_257960 [Tilletiaria anomala UBC 951]
MATWENVSGADMDRPQHSADPAAPFCVPESRRRGRKRSRRSASPSGGGERSEDDSEDAYGPGPAAVHSKLAQFGAQPLSEDDFYNKAAEFKAWLRESRRKYIDEISSMEARRYFSKFADKFNNGQLPDAYYTGAIRSAAGPSSSQTRHKWAFASGPKLSHAEQAKIESVRDTVDTLTNATSRGAKEARALERRTGKGQRMIERHGEGSHRERNGSGANAGAKDAGWGARECGTSALGGPSSASASAGRAAAGGRPAHDLQFERELESERRQRERQAERRRERRDVREEVDELAPRATGRDALTERRREKAAAHREFANRKDADDGLDVRDDVLMGGGGPDEFASALAARERAGERRHGAGERRHGAANTTEGGGGGSSKDRWREEKLHERREKLSAMKQKEADTMAMFKAMAAQRFGGGGTSSAS